MRLSRWSQPQEIAAKGILIDEATKVICQGSPARRALSIRSRLSLMARGWWGVTPERQIHLGLPVFNTVAEAVAEGAEASVIYVPAPFCKTLSSRRCWDRN